MNKHWLNTQRLRIYPRIFFGVFVLTSACWLLASRDGLDPSGKPLGYDFITFWAASWLGLHGDAASAYDLLRIHTVERLAIESTSVFAWFYPPTYLLIILPLALLPYAWAWLTFMLVTLLPFWLLMRHLLRNTKGGLWLVAAFPGLWVNLMHGQNASLTAALAGGALLLMKPHPWLAGLLVALLTTKPHMALLFPLIFILAGAWRALFSAVLGTIILTGISILVFGIPTWLAWLNGLQIAQTLNENGSLPWAKMPTIFSALRMLDASVLFAYAGQLLVAGLSVFLMIKVWLRTDELALRGSSLILATLLVSPHSFDYDLLWLALPLAWLVIRGIQKGWMRGERELLTVAWLLPMLGPIVAKHTGLQFMPFVSLGLLAMVYSKLEANVSAEGG